MKASEIKIGNVFNKLEVIAKADKHTGRTAWKCKCECGVEKIIIGKNLVNGLVKSCGCLRASKAKERMTKHGLRYEPEYIIWCGMKERCCNKNSQSYHNYGGRGITVSEDWINNPVKFIEDMGKRPSDTHDIDRKDNNQGYSKDNCHWVTRQENMNNIRGNRILTLNGVSKTNAEWSRELNCSQTTLTTRIDRYGWSVEKALTTPIKKR